MTQNVMEKRTKFNYQNFCMVKIYLKTTKFQIFVFMI